MPFLVYLLLLILFLLSGLGILQLFGLRLKPAYTITLSLILGVAVASFLPFLLQLFYIPLTAFTIFGILVLAALLLSIPTWMRIRREGLAGLRTDLIPRQFQVQPYEIPFWMIIGFLVFVSIWRCYYLPPTSRDALSGPEAIADIAVREHTMINSFFHVDLWSTNNQFKSPYLISLQLIYKLAGFPFGQVWLSTIFVSFTVFIYHALREKVHPIIAGVLLLLFLMTPEMYAYTFMILYDYSNMVYMFLGLYFLFAWCSGGDKKNFYFASLLLGIATYIRNETLVLLLPFILPILLAQRREKLPLKKLLIADVLFYLPALIGYLLPSFYNTHYLPVHLDVEGMVNPHLSDISPLFQRYGDIVTRLLVSDFAVHLWGYIFYVTAVLFVAEAVFVRRFSRDARLWLYALLVLYLGLGILGWVLPLINLNETTKRAMFKMLPMCIFYLANNSLLIRLSQAVSRWELKLPSVGGEKKPALATSRSVLTRSGKTVAVAAGKTSVSGTRKDTPATGKQQPGSRRKRKK